MLSFSILNLATLLPLPMEEADLHQQTRGELSDKLISIIYKNKIIKKTIENF